MSLLIGTSAQAYERRMPNARAGFTTEQLVQVVACQAQKQGSMETCIKRAGYTLLPAGTLVDWFESKDPKFEGIVSVRILDGTHKGKQFFILD